MENENSGVYLAAFAESDVDRNTSFLYFFFCRFHEKVLKLTQSSFPLDTFQNISEKKIKNNPSINSYVIYIKI